MTNPQAALIAMALYNPQGVGTRQVIVEEYLTWLNEKDAEQKDKNGNTN